MGGVLPGRGRYSTGAAQPAEPGVTRGATLPPTLRAAFQAADDLKARDLTVLDLRGLHDAADYFVVGSGTSDAHVRGIAHAVLDACARTRPWGEVGTVPAALLRRFPALRELLRRSVAARAERRALPWNPSDRRRRATASAGGRSGADCSWGRGR